METITAIPRCCDATEIHIVLKSETVKWAGLHAPIQIEQHVKSSALG